MTVRIYRPAKVKRPPRHMCAGHPASRPRNEAAEQRDLVKWARLAAVGRPDLRLLFAIPNGGGFSGGFKSNAIRVSRMKAAGLTSGIPDLLLAKPCHGFAGLFVEMKRTAMATVSDHQETMAAQLSAAGYAVAIAYGWHAARDAITDYLAGAFALADAA